MELATWVLVAVIVVLYLEVREIRQETRRLRVLTENSLRRQYGNDEF